MMFYHNCHNETWKEGRASIADYADTPRERNMISLSECIHQGQGSNTALPIKNETEDRCLNTLDVTYHYLAIDSATYRCSTANPYPNVI